MEGGCLVICSGSILLPLEDSIWRIHVAVDADTLLAGAVVESRDAAAFVSDILSACRTAGVPVRSVIGPLMDDEQEVAVRAACRRFGATLGLINQMSTSSKAMMIADALLANLTTAVMLTDTAYGGVEAVAEYVDSWIRRHNRRRLGAAPSVPRAPSAEPSSGVGG